MTARELFYFLLNAGALLTTAPEGKLTRRAPKGVLTPTLVDEMRTHKAALFVLMAASEAPTVVLRETLPSNAAPDAPSYRTWVTGSVPNTATAALAAPLPPPRYHDTPSPPKTYVGAPCNVKKCSPNATYPSGRAASLQYRPSGLCVACYGRLNNRTLCPDEVHDERTFLK
jgi:hypothetical protein